MNGRTSGSRSVHVAASTDAEDLYHLDELQDIRERRVTSTGYPPIIMILVQDICKDEENKTQTIAKRDYP